MHQPGNAAIQADAVICGAGITGIAVAHALATKHGWKKVLLVDERTPLSLTSDKSTEAYRNWWPGPDDAMVQFINRSIDLLEDEADARNNSFHLNRRGYLYTTANPEHAASMEAGAMAAREQGTGPVRVHASARAASTYQASTHRGFHDHPSGADVLLGSEAVHAVFPWLAPDICAALHARRCGWFSGQQLGMQLLEQAKNAGATLLAARVLAVESERGAVASVLVKLSNGSEHTIKTNNFVNAAGPYAKQVAAMLQADIPLYSEPHYKVALEDLNAAIDRNAGLTILDDPVMLPWTDEERELLSASDETRMFVERMPAGLHLRPEGYGASKTVLMLWDYHEGTLEEPLYPLEELPALPEIVLRGVARLVPGFKAYLDPLPAMYVDGGYYTRSMENRPLIGASGIEGGWLCAGFSGFGLMAAMAAGELTALHMTGSGLPSYAAAFSPSRFSDPAYIKRLESWGSTGQL